MDVSEYNLYYGDKKLLTISKGFATLYPEAPEGTGLNLTMLDSQTLDKITEIEDLDDFSRGVAIGAWRVKTEYEARERGRKAKGFVHIKEIIKEKLTRKAI